MARESSLIDDLFPEVAGIKDLRKQAAKARPLRATVPPWWETMHQDPWYITAAKIPLGEAEVEGMRKGEVAPWMNLASLLLFAGRPRGGGGGGEFLPPGGPKTPNPWGRALGQVRDAFTGIEVSDEATLPPQTKSLLDYVRADPFNPPMLPPDKPPRYNPHDVFNWENLPYAPRPGEKIAIKPEDLPFGQDIVKITSEDLPPDEAKQMAHDVVAKWFKQTPQEETLPPGVKEEFSDPNDIKNMWALPPMEKPWWDAPEMRQFLKDIHGLSPNDIVVPTAQQKWEMKLQQPEPPIGPFVPELPPHEQPLIPPQPLPGEYPPPQDLDFTQYFQQGGVARDVSLDDPEIRMFPDYVYQPDVSLVAPPDAIPPSPEYPTEVPETEFYDSNDYRGAANYYYVDPRAPQLEPPPVTNNYYGPPQEDRSEQQAYRAAMEMARSLPPATSTRDEYLKMLSQYGSMDEAARRFDAMQRRNRLMQQKLEDQLRFGPPSDPASQRLLNSPVNREYMRDFYPQISM